MVVASLVGIALGVVGAMRRNSATDYVVGIVGVVGIAVPLFVIGPLLQVFFSLQLGWLPVGGTDGGWRALILPIFVLALPNIAYISRLTRASMIETLRENYLRTARAKGIGANRVVRAHVLKGTLLPVIAYLGPATAAIITGSILIETIFALPGIGRHFVDAALNRDYPLVMGITLLYGGTPHLAQHRDGPYPSADRSPAAQWPVRWNINPRWVFSSRGFAETGWRYCQSGLLD